jgi:hypothetical protein
MDACCYTDSNMGDEREPFLRWAEGPLTEEALRNEVTEDTRDDSRRVLYSEWPRFSQLCSRWHQGFNVDDDLIISLLPTGQMYITFPPPLSEDQQSDSLGPQTDE